MENNEYARDKFDNPIGDGKYHVNYFVEDFSEYPQIETSVSLSDTTESVYVRYYNSQNGESITCRFSNHINNAVKFGYQLDGYLTSKLEILYKLGLAERIFIKNAPTKNIDKKQVKIKDVSNYEQSSLTIQQMYDLDFDSDLSKHKGKIAKGSNWLILGDKVESLDSEYGHYEYKEKLYAKGGYVTYKNKYNAKYGYSESESHSLEQISKDTGISMKGLQQIYNKGIGAYKLNPSSVRPNVKSKEQWAMARVYSAVMGGKASKVDAKELKMAKGGLIAPNGKKSNLTALQYKLVRTKAFKDWFGDWENDPENASKVVDENGEPLVVYHGSKSEEDFNVFKQQSRFEFIYFAKTKEYSWLHFTKDLIDKPFQLKSFFLNIRNLLNAEEFGFDKVQFNEIKSFFYGIYDLEKDIQLNPKNEYRFWEVIRFSNDIFNSLKKEEYYNGISFYENFYENTTWNDTDDYTLTYVVMNPNQIKLADGTNTTFDSNNPDIRFDGGGKVEDLISQGVVELKMFDTKPEHAKEYGLDSVNPLYVQSLCITENQRLKGIGNKVLKYIDDYAIKNGHDLVFGHITQKAEFTKDNRQTFFGDIDMIKNWLHSKGYAINNDNNDFHKMFNPDIRFDGGGRTLTRQEIESMQRAINDPLLSPKLKESFQKVLASRKVPTENIDFSRYPEGKYIDPYDFSGYEYMKSKNEEMGVSFLLTGEYELVSKAIFEQDYAMWLFYNYLGRINISFNNCLLWLKQAQAHFINTMPIQVVLTHQPKAKDGRSYAMWFTTSDANKQRAESRLGVNLTFEYNGSWYCNEIGMVGNYDYQKGKGWGTFYEERKTGLLVPEYTETSFHFNTLIHEFAHCYDFQSQLMENIKKFKDKKAKMDSGEIVLNTEEMSDLEKELYASSLNKKTDSVSKPITNHFEYFIDALIKILRACASGEIPLTQKFEQQALDVQTALSGVYGDLLVEQRERKRKEAMETKKIDELRENTRFTWQGIYVTEILNYIEKNAIQKGILDSLSKRGVQRTFTLSEIIEFDNLITQYANTDFRIFSAKYPSKSSKLYEDLKAIKSETNRIINNHYDNIRKNYEYGFYPNTDLDKYLEANCNVQDFRDYKSWKECNQKKLLQKMK